MDARNDAKDAEESPRTAAHGFPERHGALLITIAVVIVALAGFWAIPAFRHAVSLSIHGNLDGLRNYIRSLNAGGVALLFALILVHAVVPYPSEILTSTAGFVYGFVPGFLLALVGWTITAILTYGLGRTIGRPVLRKLLGKRFTDLERGMGSGGVRLMLSVRLLPVVPLALLGYVAGATRGSLWKLTWTSFIGYMPLTALVAYLGSQAKSLSSSNPLLWIAVIVVIALLFGPHLWSRRRAKAESGEGEPPASA